MKNEPIRILIVDDHKVVRKGLEVFLEIYDDFQLVGEASSAEEALKLCSTAKPDIVLMDLMMPRMGGVEAIRHIRETNKNIHIIALTSFSDEQLIRDALNAGATSYLLKDTDINELANTIRLAHAGKSTLSPEATRALLNNTKTAIKSKAAQRYNLTEREQEILKRIIPGASNRQIADDLKISLSTVKFHVSSILSKLDVSSRTEAATLAIQDKLV